MIAHFWDDKDGGFFETPEGDPSIRVRMKDGFDGAEMAGNSIAVQVLLVLGRLLDRAEWSTIAGADARLLRPPPGLDADRRCRSCSPPCCSSARRTARW